MWEDFAPAAPTYEVPEGDFWGQEGGGGGCPSDAVSYSEYWAETRRGNDYDEWEVNRGGPDTFSYIVGRPSWLEISWTKSPAFMGFYRSDLDAIAGHGIDPEFASIH
jgi:hypothetical protein